MAGRRKKIGLDYWPMDVNFFTDIKVRKLIKYQSGKAVTVYAYLLCTIYENGYYMKWDNELPFIISEATGYDEAYIQEVIKCCMNIDLFDKKIFDRDSVLTSKGIQERYQSISKLCNRKAIVSEFNIISSEEIAIASETMQQSKVKESKVKEIEEKELKIPPPPLNDSELDLSLVIPVFDCAKIYFEHANYQQAIELLLMNYNVEAKTVNELKHLAMKFIEHCKLDGKGKRTVKDFGTHFRYWLLDPKRKQAEQSNNEQATETPAQKRQRLLQQQQALNAANARG